MQPVAPPLGDTRSSSPRLGPAARVLVASADADTAMSLVGWLARSGVYVGLVTDTEQLSDAVKLPQAPEVVLLDESLGVSVLPSLVATVRDTPEWSRTAIVASGAFGEQMETDLLQSGADDVVGKPLRLQALVLRIRRLMAPARA